MANDLFLQFFIVCTLAVASCDGSHSGSLCSGNPCHHGGMCFEVGSPRPYTIECMCPLGYTGPFCDHRYEACAELRPCQNGARCDSWGRFYRCRCSYPFYGPNCEYIRPETTKRPPSPTHEYEDQDSDTLVPIVVVVLLIAFAGLIGCCCCCRRKSTNRNAPHNAGQGRQQHTQWRGTNSPLPTVSGGSYSAQPTSSGFQNFGFTDPPPPYASVVQMNEFKSTGQSDQATPQPPSYDEAILSLSSFGSNNDLPSSAWRSGMQACASSSAMGATACTVQSGEEQAPSSHYTRTAGQTGTPEPRTVTLENIQQRLLEQRSREGSTD